MEGKKTLSDLGREWLDTLVVAISVAMAFRAYFFEPFQIPTGSMQPTLYGNHSLPAENRSKTIWDAPVLSFFNYLITGTTYKEFKAPWSGSLEIHERGDGCIDLVVARRGVPTKVPSGVMNLLGRMFWEDELDNSTGVCRLPTDVISDLPSNGYSGVKLQLDRFCRESIGLNPQTQEFTRQRSLFVNRGDTIWKGLVKKGDFIFVNRFKWNFFRPKRGEVMIFSTTGLGANPYGRHVGTDGKRYNLQQGTHYIKRMMGTPGETLQIRDGKLFVDGRLTAYEKPEGASGEAKRQLINITPARVDYDDSDWKSGVFHLGKSDYFAAGDNSEPERMSYDSRFWGPVPGELLRGCASIVFWPIVNPRWGIIR